MFSIFHKSRTFWVLGLILVGLFVGFWPGSMRAATVEELQNQIAEKTRKIKDLEAEIRAYEQAVGKTKEEALTLKNTIAQLDAVRKKLTTEIALTNEQIDRVGATIDSLSIEIESTSRSIDQQLSGISASMRMLAKATDRTPIEVLFSRDTLSESANEIAVLSQLESEMRAHAEFLRNSKSTLTKQQSEKEAQRKTLESLQGKLSDQKQITDQNKQSKTQLLSETKSKEAAYQQLLASRKKMKEQIEAEIFDYESRLKIALDIEKLPSIGSGALLWPVDTVRITQEFGNTSFSRTHALVYSGKGHNGIDLGVSIGTPIYSARGGVVAGTGNTDLGCPGGSYGKWVLLTHDNGLSTLYAHLSLIKVTEGQMVDARELIAYSGNTGYSTGPHLHFTVYASQGVKITNIIRADGSISSCGKMPVSPLNGYLNPLLYLQER